MFFEQTMEKMLILIVNYHWFILFNRIRNFEKNGNSRRIRVKRKMNSP